MNKEFEIALKDAATNGNRLLSTILSWDSGKIIMLKECLEKIEEWNFIKRMWDKREIEDRVQMRQDVRDIYTWVTNNFIIISELIDFKIELEEFMIKHQIDANYF